MDTSKNITLTLTEEEANLLNAILYSYALTRALAPLRGITTLLDEAVGDEPTDELVERVAEEYWECWEPL